MIPPCIEILYAEYGIHLIIHPAEIENKNKKPYPKLIWIRLLDYFKANDLANF